MCCPFFSAFRTGLVRCWFPKIFFPVTQIIWFSPWAGSCLPVCCTCLQQMLCSRLLLGRAPMSEFCSGCAFNLGWSIGEVCGWSLYLFCEETHAALCCSLMPMLWQLTQWLDCVAIQEFCGISRNRFQTPECSNPTRSCYSSFLCKKSVSSLPRDDTNCSASVNQQYFFIAYPFSHHGTQGKHL